MAKVKSGMVKHANLSVNAFPLYTFPFKPYHYMKSKLLAGVAALLLPALFISCKNSGNVKPSATGARFELLIVMDDDLWHAPAGQAVFNLFDQDTIALAEDLEHLADFPLILARDDHHLVVLTNTKLLHRQTPRGLRGQARRSS